MEHTKDLPTTTTFVVPVHFWPVFKGHLFLWYVHTQQHLVEISCTPCKWHHQWRRTVYRILPCIYNLDILHKYTYYSKNLSNYFSSNQSPSISSSGTLSSSLCFLSRPFRAFPLTPVLVAFGFCLPVRCNTLCR